MSCNDFNTLSPEWEGECCAYCCEEFTCNADIHEATLNGETDEPICSHYEECFNEHYGIEESDDEEEDEEDE